MNKKIGEFIGFGLAFALAILSTVGAALACGVWLRLIVSAFRFGWNLGR